MSSYNPNASAIDKIGRARNAALEARAGFAKDTDGYRRCNYVIDAIDEATTAFEIAYRMDQIHAKENELGDLRIELGELQRLRDGGAR